MSQLRQNSSVGVNQGVAVSWDFLSGEESLGQSGETLTFAKSYWTIILFFSDMSVVIFAFTSMRKLKPREIK